MARFTQTGSGDGSGTPGPTGPTGPQGDPGPAGADGANGADAIWNFTGEYSGGAAYAVGDIATYNGQTWYRVNSNGGNVGDVPSEGLWTLIADKGANGADGADGTNGTNGSDFGIYYLGNYVSTNGYLPDIAVVRGSDGQLYLAKASGQLGDPVDYLSNGQWEIWIPKGADGADGQDGTDANLDTGTTTINSYNPVWSGTGLAYTNTPATGSYIKIGNLVTVQIDVLFTNVSNFGTGAYSLTLPVASKYHTDVYGGSIHKITNQGIDHYSLKGHLSPTSSSFTLWAIGSSAADQAFNNNTPINIDTDDKFHMSFSYICE